MPNHIDLDFDRYIQAIQNSIPNPIYFLRPEYFSTTEAYERAKARLKDISTQNNNTEKQHVRN